MTFRSRCLGVTVCQLDVLLSCVSASTLTLVFSSFSRPCALIHPFILFFFSLITSSSLHLLSPDSLPLSASFPAHFTLLSPPLFPLYIPLPSPPSFIPPSSSPSSLRWEVSELHWSRPGVGERWVMTVIRHRRHSPPLPTCSPGPRKPEKHAEEHELMNTHLSFLELSSYFHLYFESIQTHFPAERKMWLFVWVWD